MSGTVRPPSGIGIAQYVSPLSAPSRTGPSATAMTRVSGFTDTPAPLQDLPLACPSCGARYPGEFNVCPKDGMKLVGSAGAQVVDDLVGQTLRDTYRLVRVLGEGGMGRVYEAEHARIRNKRFAIKTLHPEFIRHDEVLLRFAREAEASATIKSEHVMQVFDVDKTEDGRPFMVGEFLEGRELADYLQQVGKLRVASAVRIARQLCAGLTAAHRMGIVHRDMKPENVFLTGELTAPIAKIIDFGISKSGDEVGSKLTKTGMIMGTPSFMAPEQARGDASTPQVDVYATGAILYMMLTGERPFDKPDTTATLTAVLLEEPARPRLLEPSIPEGLEVIIQRAMAKRPEDRFGSLADFDRELAAYDDSVSTSQAHAMMASVEEPSATAELDARKTRALAMLLGGLAVSLVAGVVLTIFSSLVRVVRGGLQTTLTGTEAAVAILLVVLVLAAPVALGVLHVKKQVWSSTAALTQLVRRWRWPLAVSLATYGVGSLTVRVLDIVLLRQASAAAWPVWDLLMAAVAVGAAAASVVLLRK